MPFISTLKAVYDDALYKSTFILLYFIYTLRSKNFDERPRRRGGFFTEEKLMRNQPVGCNASVALLPLLIFMLRTLQQ